MSSETGLKRRNVAAASGAGGGGGSGAISDGSNRNENPDGENADNDIDEQNEEFDADSKSTRLTLMEEILLLGLKDKEVNNPNFPRRINFLRIYGLIFVYIGLYLVLE